MFYRGSANFCLLKQDFYLSSWCLVMVERLFLTVPLGCLQFVIVVFPDHTHLLFLIFKSFIQSNFNYCPLAWHFFSKANTEKLEKKLQYIALRIVFNDYISSYESLLSKVNLPTLHMNRLRCIATETYTCINNKSPEYLRDLVEVKQTK